MQLCLSIEGLKDLERFLRVKALKSRVMATCILFQIFWLLYQNSKWVLKVGFYKVNLPKLPLKI